ncbi:MAG: lipoyl synthase, partial [Coriobacteriia bacterium]|nr:lipoyl synthase [Coriobacteriia bacterium]
HVVVTSVTRDDLPDGGAAHFVAVIEAVRAALPETTIEVLTSDFAGRLESVDAVIAARPDVFNHNLETVPRLYETVRPGADYARSLAVLERAGAAPEAPPTKSGLMLGLGESAGEIVSVMRDLRVAGVSLLTLGQYLRPSAQHLPVAEFVQPEVFEQLAVTARELGFAAVTSSPFARSSYHAGEMAREAQSEPNAAGNSAI